MITAREKNFLQGRSDRTISHARTAPSTMAHTDTHTPMVRELSSGLTSMVQDSSLASSLCQ